MLTKQQVAEFNANSLYNVIIRAGDMLSTQGPSRLLAREIGHVNAIL